MTAHSNTTSTRPSFISLALLTLLLILNAVHAEDSSAPIVHLSADIFKDKIKSGTWIIEFFAPWCPHCQAFAPKYAAFATDVVGWRESHNMYVANVDCDENEQLCTDHKVTGFPTVYAFHNGVREIEFKGDQTYGAIKKFATDMKAKFATQTVPPPATDSSSLKLEDGALAKDLVLKQAEFTRTMRARNIPGLGVHGKVVDLVLANFDLVTSQNGPWILEFYAPWCSHCQKLEPIYTKLATNLKGKMNFGRVNADSEPELSKQFGIKGYPTIKLLKSGTVTEYQDARTYESLERFALQAGTVADIKHVTFTEFSRLRTGHEVCVVFAYGKNAIIEDWIAFLDAVDSWTLPTVTGIYASVDPQFSPTNGHANVLVYRNGFGLEVPRYPAGREDESAAKKDEDKIIYDDEAALKLQAEAHRFTSAAVRQFVTQHRYSLLPELTDTNAEDIMDGTPTSDPHAPLQQTHIVVLGIIDPSNSQMNYHREILNQVANQIYKESKNRMLGIRIQVVWLNGNQWADYIHRAYALKVTDLPRVVISIPAIEEYYAFNTSGTPVPFQTKDIVAAITDVVQVKANVPGYVGTMVPVSTRSMFVSWVKHAWLVLGNLSSGFLLSAVSVSVLGIYCLCCRQSNTAQYDRLDPAKFD